MRLSSGTAAGQTGMTIQMRAGDPATKGRYAARLGQADGIPECAA